MALKLQLYIILSANVCLLTAMSMQSDRTQATGPHQDPFDDITNKLNTINQVKASVYNIDMNEIPHNTGEIAINNEPDIPPPINTVSPVPIIQNSSPNPGLPQSTPISIQDKPEQKSSVLFPTMSVQTQRQLQSQFPPQPEIQKQNQLTFQYPVPSQNVPHQSIPLALSSVGNFIPSLGPIITAGLGAIGSYATQLAQRQWGPFDVNVGAFTLYPMINTSYKLLQKLYENLPPVNQLFNSTRNITTGVFSKVYEASDMMKKLGINYRAKGEAMLKIEN